MPKFHARSSVNRNAAGNIKLDGVTCTRRGWPGYLTMEGKGGASAPPFRRIHKSVPASESKGEDHKMKATATQLDNRDQLLVRLAESRSMTDDLFRIVRTECAV